MKKTIMKKKTLFDHIKQITNIQNPNYWEEISDEDKKSWSNYMVNRFLSMKMEWVTMVNDIQKLPLEPKVLYKLYSNILPKGRVFLKYIKGSKDMAYEKWLLEIVAKHFELSLVEAKTSLDFWYATEQGKQELLTLLKRYGVDPKEIKKLNLR